MACAAHLYPFVLNLILLLGQLSNLFAVSEVHNNMRARRLANRLRSHSDVGRRYFGTSESSRRSMEGKEIEGCSKHTHFMRLALRHAQHAFREKEVPIGAVIADPSGKIIATGRNQVEKLQDPTV